MSGLSRRPLIRKVPELPRTESGAAERASTSIYRGCSIAFLEAIPSQKSPPVEVPFQTPEDSAAHSRPEGRSHEASVHVRSRTGQVGAPFQARKLRSAQLGGSLLLRGNYPSANSEPHEAGHVVDVEAVHELGAVGFHGLDADV